MRFPTMWYVRPAKTQTSLHKRAVWSEPLLVAWVLSNWPNRISRLESLSLHLSKCYFSGHVAAHLLISISGLRREISRLCWMWTSKTQIRLRIRTVRSALLQFAPHKVYFLNLLHTIFNNLAGICRWEGWLENDLVGILEDRISNVDAHMRIWVLLHCRSIWACANMETRHNIGNMFNRILNPF